jgi:D-amino-acid dehydrogenase
VTVRDERERIVVIGSGVVGLCCAYYLARSGRSVVVLERGEIDGNNCSRENAGMVVPSHFTPLAAPGVVTQGLKWLLDRESPFYVRPRLSLDLMRWGWEFVMHANANHVAGSAELLRDLHLASRELFDELSGEFDFGLNQRGLLMLCETEALLEEETELAMRARELGLKIEVCDPKRLALLDPDIEMRVKGGIWYEQDCHMEPGRFVAGLKAELGKLGGEIRYQCEVEAVGDSHVRLESGEKIAGEKIVIAGGAWTPGLAKTLNLRVPMQAGKGYSMTLKNPPKLPRLCSLLGEAKVAVTPMGDSLRIAGTMEICGNDLSINERRVSGIIKAACRVFPALSPECFEGVKRWSGLRPCSPDGLPYVGAVPGRDDVLVASGHAMLGLSLGPITGKLVAEVVKGEAPSYPLAQLAPGRFA